MRKKIINVLMPVLGGLLFAGCPGEYDDGELWSKVNTLDRRVGDIETTLSQLNSDLDAIRMVVTSSESGLSVTSVSQTADGWRVTYNNGSSFTLPNLNDGQSPFIQGGNWWIGSTNTGVKAAGTIGRSVFAHNGTWWIGDTDTGISIFPLDGRTPRIGPNNNWWVGDTDTGIPAMGIDGLSPHIGTNGNWWLGTTDTGVSAGGQGGSTANVPILGVDLFTDGRYYWTQTLNGVKTWLLDSRGHMMPVSGSDAQRPIIRVNVEGYWTISYDGGITYVYILDGNGERVSLIGDGCQCTTYFSSVEIVEPYLVIILVDGTVIRIPLGGSKGIPDEPVDPTPDPGPPPYDPVIPNPSDDVEPDGNDIVVRLDLSGIQDPVTGEWIKLYGTGMRNQNVWLDVEGTPKAIKVINNSEQSEEAHVRADIVFAVDNSGSMGDEADGVARDIMSWASLLASSNLDVRFGCVGYGRNVGAEFSYLVNNYGVSGAMNLGSKDDLNYFLNSRGKTSIDRTVGYYGSDAYLLETTASLSAYSRAGGECGVQAIRFADENFSFRETANRIYVNFTDDANYTGGNNAISVNYFANQSTWQPYKGTIHSVLSSTKAQLEDRVASTGNAERPWLMSEYTGGSIHFVPSNFSGVTLDILPVTSAMRNSYVIYFRNVLQWLDGKSHEVTITIITPDGHVRTQRTFYITFSAL